MATVESPPGSPSASKAGAADARSSWRSSDDDTAWADARASAWPAAAMPMPGAADSPHHPGGGGISYVWAMTPQGPALVPMWGGGGMPGSAPPPMMMPAQALHHNGGSQQVQPFSAPQHALAPSGPEQAAKQPGPGPSISEVEPAEGPGEAGGPAAASAWARLLRTRSVSQAAANAASLLLSGLLVFMGVALAAGLWLAGQARRQARLVAAAAARIAPLRPGAPPPAPAFLLLTKPPAGNPTLLLAAALPDATSPFGSPAKGRQYPKALPAPPTRQQQGQEEQQEEQEAGPEPLLDVADSAAHVTGLWLGLGLSLLRLSAGLPLVVARIGLRAGGAAAAELAAAAGEAAHLSCSHAFVVARSSLAQLADSHLLLPNAVLLPLVGGAWRALNLGLRLVAWLLLAAARAAGDEGRADAPDQLSALGLDIASKQEAVAAAQAEGAPPPTRRTLLYDVDGGGGGEAEQPAAAGAEATTPAERACAAVRAAAAPLQLCLARGEQALGLLRAQLMQQDPRELQLVPVVVLAGAAGRQAAALAAAGAGAALGMAEAAALWLAAVATQGAPAMAQDMLRTYLQYVFSTARRIGSESAQLAHQLASVWAAHSNSGEGSSRSTGVGKDD